MTVPKFLVKAQEFLDRFDIEIQDGTSAFPNSEPRFTVPLLKQIGRFGLQVVISNWILATGFWNDSGVWDDTASWKDS